ncbi:stalk domain-containing protein [Marinisporobacter balticus]|uniref:Copper amine oxidase-like protein n=1 Tax=Marinisporobacter balticus TaxID=2018667 RepID=A0A4R2K982_9FIRM|nr:stalk domain-containing protein [Marinisporobacter balticus]TCO69254.1 copper amine oxidase-like protein [Marinisporobacter balticus]
MLKKFFLTIIAFTLLSNYNIFSFANDNNNPYPCFINNKLIYLNNNEKPFKLISTVDPKADKVVLMFPIKNFFESLAFKVSWIEKERKILATKNNRTIEFFVDEKDEKKMVRMDNHYISLYFRSDLKGKNISIKNGIAFTDLDFLINWLYGTGIYIEEKGNILTDGRFSLIISDGSSLYEQKDTNSMFWDSRIQPFKTSYQPKGFDHLSIFCKSFPLENSDIQYYDPKDLYGNAPSIYINNQLLFIQKNEVPYIKQSINDHVVMVPLKIISEYVGCNFQFDKSNKIISLLKDGNKVQISLPEKKIIDNTGDFNMSNTSNIEIDVKDDVIFIDFDFLIHFSDGIYYYWKTPSNKISSYISF